MISEAVVGHSGQSEDRGQLLSPDEQTGCRQLAAGDPPHNQRAQALLALDQGMTQKEAGQKAELTEGQVSYWLGRFRKARMAIFPEPSPTPIAPQPEPPPAAAEEVHVEQLIAIKPLQPEALTLSAPPEAEKTGSNKKKKAQKKKKGRGKKSKKGAKDKVDKKSRKKKKDGPGKGGKKSKSKKKSPKKKSGSKNKSPKKKKRDKSKKKNR